MPEIIAHPETGLPVEAQVNYLAIERTDLEAKLSAAEEAAQTAQTNLDAATTADTEAQAALEDSKSSLAKYDAIAPQPAVEPETTEPSGQDTAGDQGDTEESLETPAEETAEVEETPVF